ncbi:glutamate receptor 2.7-like isoform X1 [Trifolium pratense]|uniref:glutamate receptor 2.7-like isoform X1 n=2 Tax=Trifolium pratense TaxID=57577 RepID=UPI001E694A1C|nr:glutamate receptor 2.7-like isoform X1 [Trifolium pratense]
MNIYAETSNSVPNILLRLPLIIMLLLFHCLAGSSQTTTSIGVIIDVNSETGKQQRTAMQIAAQSFNNYSNNQNIILFFRDSNRNPLQAASDAEELITKEKVKVIIGMETWQEAALVADLGAKFQVPTISFSSPPLVSLSLMQLRWPFLIQMAHNHSAQMNFIANMIHAFNSQQVIAIYENNPYSTDSGMLSLLSEALQKVNSHIEYVLVLPPFISLSNPKGFVLDELLKLLPLKSRVFIVLQASLPMVNYLFTEAKKIGLLEKDSSWIINEEITSMLGYIDKSVLSSMEAVLGIKNNYSTSSSAYTQLRENLQADHTEKVESEPGSKVLLAYDSISTVTKALEKMNTNSISSKMLLEEMVSSNFNGLIGDIRFKERQLSNTPILRVIKVVDNDKKVMELDFWTPKLKFAESLSEKTSDGTTETRTWKVPTVTNPLKVAIPMYPIVDKFLEVSQNHSASGFCIDLFNEIRVILSDQYSGLPYRFYTFTESYDTILPKVIDETYDAIVGDVTILADRSRNVSFTQPYTESGLSLILPAENDDSAWLFMKPFSWEMWFATVVILIYTMFIIWFLEHRLNPEFGGPLKTQISNTLWFAFSSLFSVHREKINSNSARVVVGVWLFLVLVLTSSYTANLSSLLTVPKLRSDRNIEWLKQNNLPIGCASTSAFLKNYLIQVYNIPRHQIVDVGGEDDYMDKFKNKKISAIFAESPYVKLFLNKHCKDYIATTAAYKFGGMGFVFQKDAPIAKDFSVAILTLAENGKLKALEDKWLTPSNQCSNNSPSPQTESLTLNKFWGIYLICAATSTICLLLASLKKYLCKGNVIAEYDDNKGNQNWTGLDRPVQLVEFGTEFASGPINTSNRYASGPINTSNRYVSGSYNTSNRYDNTSNCCDTELDIKPV